MSDEGYTFDSEKAFKEAVNKTPGPRPQFKMAKTELPEFKACNRAYNPSTMCLAPQFATGDVGHCCSSDVGFRHRQREADPEPDTIIFPIIPDFGGGGFDGGGGESGGGGASGSW
jgi:hypothetical protein